MDTATFLHTHRVFTLEDAVKTLAPAGGRNSALERLKYAVRRGKAKRVAREVYASIPPGADPKKFQPDPYLVAASIRSDAVFSHHSALELLGAAHSEWHICTVFTRRRRAPLRLGNMELRFMAHPSALGRGRLTSVGTRKVYRLDRPLCVAGPERTLVDGFREVDLVGGLEELLESAAGFSVLDLKLLYKILEAYNEKTLWAAVGWFLESHKRNFYVDDRRLRKLETRVPKSPHYLLPGERGGTLLRRWNLIVPQSVAVAGGGNESQL
ncbi:MAG: hypothetical protein ACE5JO_03285 [Candidatus Binatia bacterium]